MNELSMCKQTLG